MPLRPASEAQYQEWEAIGIIRASRFVRTYARSRRLITMQTVRKIHKEIFRTAWTEIAGEYRTENLEITGSQLVLPHYQDVPFLMYTAEKEFTELLGALPYQVVVAHNRVADKDTWMHEIAAVIHATAWIHHRITMIHPFREGNGRTARLAGNLVLERYGLVGISIKIEKEHKNRYRQALTQADTFQDFEPLETLIYEGVIDRYNGVQVKYYPES